MKKFEKIILFFIILSVRGIISQAQYTEKLKPTHYRALHWTVQDGLTQGRNMDMIKDVNGFLWVASHLGLSRFDGSNFKKYFADNSRKRNTIAGNDINGLVEDSLHNIWIGTDLGISMYNFRTDTFKNFFSDKASAFVIPFWATKDEVFCWDYPDSQLAAINIHSFIKRSLTKINQSDSVGIGISDHYPIYDAGSNSIWLSKFDAAGGGFLQISLANGKRQEYTWKCFLKIPKHPHGWEGMRYDRRRNSIWIASPDGLIEFTLSDHQFHHVEAFNELERNKEFHQWAGIDIDPRGRIWAGTSPKGIFIYDPADSSIHPAFPDDSTLQQNTAWANVLIYCDRDGIVWSGSWLANGIYQMIPYSSAVVRYVADSKPPLSVGSDFVVNCLDAGKGKIWIGTGDGISVLDQATNLFEVIRKKDLVIEKGNDDVIFLAGIDSLTQKLWLYANGLIYQTDMVSRTSRPIIYKDAGVVIPPVNGFCASFRNSIIIAGESGNRQGIFVVDGDSGVANQILSFPAGTIDITKPVTDGDRLIFLRRTASATNLTYLLKAEGWKSLPNSMDSIPWLRAVYNKADQTYWAATINSIYHFSKGLRLMKVYGRDEGFPESDVYGMITDNRNNLWFNADNFIYQLDNSTGRITTLTEKDGFQKQNFTPLLDISKSASGELFLGGGVSGRGLNRIYPSKYILTPAFVYLQSLLINQKPAVLSTGINNLQEMSLKYFENQITIETGIIDYYSGGNSHIRYKLGEYSNWQYPVNSARYTIHYEDLPPGKYQLIMQAANASNEFIGPEKILVINISPPWWQTWWARSLFILAVAIVLWRFIQYRSRNLKKRNAELEEKVMHRTKELKHSLEDLRTTQTQLIQREKMASLGELTAGIAHEIQNPLNFVNNFSDLNSELIDEMKQEVESGNLTEGLLVADIIKENNLKINNHGRRADSIVKGMLLHSRQNSGHRELVNINSLADEYLRLSYHGLRAKDKTFNATLQTNYDDQIGLINIVPQDIGRVFLNLFNNSFYAVSEKRKLQITEFEPTICISTKKSGQQMEIRIKDNGSGIPQNLLDKIFQPFFTTKPTGEGTGLGLSLSYEIITKGHGGTIDIDTKEGEFTEFIITLPITNNSKTT
jgi:signal transduction histidine kinase/ligand-binding sensor domain-containing protein